MRIADYKKWFDTHSLTAGNNQISFYESQVERLLIHAQFLEDKLHQEIDRNTLLRHKKVDEQ